jgi:sulfur-oxidizing protein SoxX
MRKTKQSILAFLTLSLLTVGMSYARLAQAAGEMPDKATCANTHNSIIAGGCIATDVNKGNCMACHAFRGLQEARIPAGNIGPELLAMKQRYPDRRRLRALIFDERQFNPNTVMPPYGSFHILSEKEIDLVLDWLYSL